MMEVFERLRPIRTRAPDTYAAVLAHRARSPNSYFASFSHHPRLADLVGVGERHAAEFAPVSYVAFHCQPYLDPVNFVSMYQSWLHREGETVRVVNSAAIKISGVNGYGANQVCLPSGDFASIAQLSRRTERRCAVLSNLNETLVYSRDERIARAYPRLDAQFASAFVEPELETRLERVWHRVNRRLYAALANGRLEIESESSVGQRLADEPSTSLAGTILFGEHTERFARAFADHVARELPLIHYSTTMYWYVDRGRLRACHLVDGFLAVEQADLKISLAQVPALLASGSLVPDLFIVYFFLTILARTRCVGGTRQLYYLQPAYRFFVDFVLELAGRPTAGERDEQVSFWGARVIERHGRYERRVEEMLATGRGFEDLRAELEHLTLEELISHDVFARHPIWQHIRD